MNKICSDMNEINTMFIHMMNHKHNSSSDNKDSQKVQFTNTVVPDNNKYTPLEGGHSTKSAACGLLNMISTHQNSMNYL